ncbi:carbohydrate ABC transporter permease [Pelagibius sp. Alg239-R121]|uniref:carbohydrate ABC transporter permease n=1 Tax=Pelagibius sp. Alg239-R121 TaxID=2993448 RepID=UPI0024A63DA5|nr:sugar ABC transporter permease [Pelagibius sp. Alg239-R121]
MQLPPKVGIGRQRSGLFTGERGFALLMVSPGLLVLILTTTFPLAYLIWSSFQNINLAMPFLDGFAGLDNYRNMMSDGRYWHAQQLTAIYTISSVFLQIAIGLGLALLVMQIPAGQWLFRIMAILPIVLAPVVVGLFWRTLMLAPEFGIVDFIVRVLGFGSVNWLGSPTPALISVIIIHTWQWTPFAFLVLLASLASLPPDIYEAARIDKANAFQRFIHITLPLIRPAIIIVVIMRSMIALSAFAAIFAATGGGPGTASEILNLYAYKTSFVELNFGYGSALAVSLLIITLGVSGILFHLRTAKRN